MKKIFLVSRLNSIDYDEYDSCVIIADNEEEVHKMIDTSFEGYEEIKEYSSYWDDGIFDRKITEIDIGNCKSQLLLSSFNAG